MTVGLLFALIACWTCYRIGVIVGTFRQQLTQVSYTVHEPLEPPACLERPVHPEWN